MQSKTNILSRRKKQPGHDKTYIQSEQQLENVVVGSLNPALFDVEIQPKDLLGIFKNTERKRGERSAYGIKPELKIRCKSTNKTLILEVKKQGKRGNADERACKYHTIEFQKTIRKHYNIDYNPIVTIFCEDLAILPRYICKYPYYFEEGCYFCWVDYENVGDLQKFIEKRIRDTIYDGPESVFLPN